MPGKPATIVWNLATCGNASPDGAEVPIASYVATSACDGVCLAAKVRQACQRRSAKRGARQYQRCWRRVPGDVRPIRQVSVQGRQVDTTHGSPPSQPAAAARGPRRRPSRRLLLLFIGAEKRHYVPPFLNVGKSITTTTCLPSLHTTVVVKTNRRGPYK